MHLLNGWTEARRSFHAWLVTHGTRKRDHLGAIGISDRGLLFGEPVGEHLQSKAQLVGIEEASGSGTIANGSQDAQRTVDKGGSAEPPFIVMCQGTQRARY